MIAARKPQGPPRPPEAALRPVAKGEGLSKPEEAKAKLARLHSRIATIRSAALHRLDEPDAGRFHTIGIENLNVRGMLANRSGEFIADMGFFEFRRRLEYKAAMRGGQVVLAGRFFPSSRRARTAAARSTSCRWPCAAGRARTAAERTTVT